MVSQAQLGMLPGLSTATTPVTNTPLSQSHLAGAPLQSSGECYMQYAGKD